MRRLDARLAELARNGEGAFAPFLVLGDPGVEDSLHWIDTIAATGPDLFEFGFPFSDPPADGPVIQSADARALAAGVTVEDCFRMLAETDRRHRIPAALLVYANLVLSCGVDRFYERCAACGAEAVLVADVPLEESDPFVAAARRHGIAPVFVASRLSGDDRLDRIRESGEGYVYLVGRVGVTGERSELRDDLPGLVHRVRERTGLPVLVGFGISTPDQVRAVLAAGADGAIAGSALVRRIAQCADEPERGARELAGFARSMKDATRGA